MEETTPKEPVEKPPTRLVVPGLLFPDAAAFLRAHGCIIEPHVSSDNHIRTTVTLPRGSARTRKSVATNERYLIVLPDGTEIREVYDSADGHSALFVPAQHSEKKQLFASIPYKFRHKPLLFAGRARQFYGLEQEDYSGDYDFIVSPEDFQGLRARCPEAHYFTTTNDDECVHIGNFEFYETFGSLPYAILSVDAVEQRDHLVVSLTQLLTVARIALEAAPDNEKKQRDVEVILEKLNASLGEQ
jgi:hypothetical protein